MRLIDADALLEKMKGTDRYFMIKFDIEEAPTVNPWHYPSKGEYPTKGDKVLAYVQSKTKTKMLLEVVYSGEEWNPANGFLGIGSVVLAWQYIIPPQEEV